MTWQLRGLLGACNEPGPPSAPSEEGERGGRHGDGTRASQHLAQWRE